MSRFLALLVGKARRPIPVALFSLPSVSLLGAGLVIAFGQTRSVDERRVIRAFRKNGVRVEVGVKRSVVPDLPLKASFDAPNYPALEVDLFDSASEAAAIVDEFYTGRVDNLAIRRRNVVALFREDPSPRLAATVRAAMNDLWRTGSAGHVRARGRSLREYPACHLSGHWPLR